MTDIARNTSVWRHFRIGYAFEAVGKHGTHNEMFVSRRLGIGINTCEPAIKPSETATEERVIYGILFVFLFFLCCCVVFVFVSVCVFVFLIQVSLISDTDFIGKYLFQFGTLFGKPHLNSERIATEIAVAKSVVLEINFVVSIPCFVGEVAVMLFVGIIAHYIRHFAHSVGKTPEHVSMNFVIAREFLGRNPIT